MIGGDRRSLIVKYLFYDMSFKAKRMKRLMGNTLKEITNKTKKLMMGAEKLSGQLKLRWIRADVRQETDGQ